jgi:hypothetical protein
MRLLSPTFAGCLLLGRRGDVGEQAALMVVVHFSAMASG